MRALSLKANGPHGVPTGPTSEDIGEIHDLHFGPDRGTYFNRQRPLTQEMRFPGQKRKKPRV